MYLVSEKRGQIMVTIDLGYATIYLVMAISMVWWLISVIKDNAEQRYYWLGRKDGWDMHRRMIQNKVKTDEVFDYDKN